MSIFSKLKIGRDDGGYVTNEIPWGQLDQNYKIKLAAGVEETLSVPSFAYRIKYTTGAGGIVWCGFGSTPLVLSAGNFFKEVSELNPIVRPAFDYLGKRITTLRFLSENDTFLSVIFYPKYDSDVTR